MNFYIDFARVALASYPLYRPPTEHPIMKRQLLLSLTLAVLTANAYALPAREQAAPQAQASHATVSQVLNTLAEDGSSRTPQAQHERENGLAENGSSKTAIGENDKFAENGSDHTPQAQHERENGLAENGSSKTAIGENDKFAENGSAHTPQAQHERENGLAENGSSKTSIGENDKFAEGGRARLEEKGLVQDGGDRVIERNSSLS
ncbi:MULTISPECIES: hypothetical protein [unclassified Pseudomonas]|nr:MULTISPECIES: hypothetical protein [unclassified Pseudomonas]